MKLLRFSMTAILVGVMLSGTGCTTIKKWFGWGPKEEVSTAGIPGPDTGLTPLVTPSADVPLDKGIPARGNAINAVHSPEWDGIVVYFAFDSSAIGTSELPKLEQIAKVLKENDSYAVEVDGNCDERGSAEYNRGLGERRALAVREYLVSRGIADTRIDTVSYGSEKPVIPNAKSEDDHAKNRRAEFVIGTRSK